MKAIYKKELSSYFSSTLGYIILALYFFFSGLFFWLFCFQNTQNNLSAVINSMLNIVFFIIPLITMKSFSEEKRQHTDQALYSAPVGLGEVVLGKYFGALTLYVGCCMIYFVYALVLIIVVPGTLIPWGRFFAAFLGIILLGAALLAMNLMFSSITEHQIIAAVIGMAAGFFIMLYDTLVAMLETFIQSVFSVDYSVVFLDKLSVTLHYENFSNGILSPVDFIYFLSWIAIFLFVTDRILDRKRWA